MGGDFGRTPTGHDGPEVSTRHVHCEWAIKEIEGQSGSCRVTLDT